MHEKSSRIKIILIFSKGPDQTARTAADVAVPYKSELK